MEIISKDIVKRVAFLSRLELSEKELDIHSKQLGSILAYINKLSELDTKNTVPTSHPLNLLKNIFRKDVPKASLSPEDALASAPSKEDNFFKVPQVIEGK